MTKELRDSIFENFYTDHFKMVLDICFGMVRDIHKAEDLAQESMLHIYEVLHKFGNQSKLTTWIHSVVRNFCYNKIRYERTKKRYAPTESIDNIIEQMDSEYGRINPKNIKALVSSEKDALTQICEKEDYENLMKIVDSLPPKQASAFKIYFNNGDVLSEREAGEKLGIETKSVGQKLVRIRKVLRRKIYKYKNILSRLYGLIGV